MIAVQAQRRANFSQLVAQLHDVRPERARYRNMRLEKLLQFMCFHKKNFRKSQVLYTRGVGLRGTLAMWVRVAVAIVLLLLPTALHAQAEKRIALLIGNKDYKAGVGSLTNPLNDIRIVGEALKAVGFEVLKPVENAQRSAMLIAIHAFRGQAESRRA